MSTLKAVNFQHPSSGSANIELGADGSVVLPAGFTGGMGTNVVSATLNGEFSTTSPSYVGVTGLSVSITPTSSSSKILIIGIIAIGRGVSAANEVLLRRDSSALVTKSGTSDTFDGDIFAAVGDNINFPFVVAYLDSPATTSNLTYDFAIKTNSGAVVVNRETSISSITAIEVAA